MSSPGATCRSHASSSASAPCLSRPSSAGITSTGEVLGTPTYMSPEQAMGKKVDARSDLWSVGTLIYGVLASRPAFAGASYNAVIIAIDTAEHTPQGDAPSELARCLTGAMER